MNREEATRAGIVKDLLCAVAVVDVEIGDQDSVEVEAGERFGRGQGDVGVDAEPHPLGRTGMVPGRPDQTKSTSGPHRPRQTRQPRRRHRPPVAPPGLNPGRPRYQGRACLRPRLPARRPVADTRPSGPGPVPRRVASRTGPLGQVARYPVRSRWRRIACNRSGRSGWRAGVRWSSMRRSVNKVTAIAALRGSSDRNAVFCLSGTLES